MKIIIDSKARRYGFTIIELIVVIAVIAIITAISIPKFLEYGERAKNSRDLANLATLNLMTRIYRYDFPEVNIDEFEAAAMMEALIPDYLTESMLVLQKNAIFAWTGVPYKKWFLLTTNGEILNTLTSEEFFIINSSVNSDYRIAGYDGRGGTDIVIPSEINGTIITWIDQSAFFWNYKTNTWAKLSSVVLPESLERISGNAFNANSLTTIDIPDNVTYLGANAFYNNKLSSVIFGNGLTNIGDAAFANNSFTEVFLPPNINNIGTGAFSGNKIIKITIGSGVNIQNSTSLGTYGNTFKNYYDGIANKETGTYIYGNGSWRKTN